MTRVCLVGSDDVNLRYELLSRETSRDALATYDLQEPYANAIGVETVSLGAAVSLLNDLNWYLVRFVEHALVFEPSVSDSEWLSRDVATAIREDELAPEDTGRFLKVFGVREPASGPDDDDGDPDGGPEPDADGPTVAEPPELLDPMLVARTGETIPEYDLYEVSETLVVRVTESEFDA
jgi:hypothetical protein